MDGTILKVTRLGKRYPRFELREVSFELPRGYIMGFIGPNGAGKTTTIKIIMNLVFPDTGKVEVFSLDSQEHEREVKRLIGYVGEEQHFYGDMSVGWTAGFVRNYYPSWDDGLYRKLSQKFGLDQGKRIKELSKGTRVKFALALALAHRPPLLILDEPTSGLDPVARHELLQELLEVIQDENRSVFFSSHITEDIEKVADYVTVIHGGRVLLSEVKDDILDHWKRVRFRADRPLGELRRELVWLKEERGECVGVTPDFGRFRERYTSFFPGHELQAQNLGLDEILLSLVKGGA